MKTAHKTNNQFFTLLIGLTLIITFLSNYFHLGWISATLWAFGMYLLLLGYALIKKEQLVQDFIIFGTIAGFIELVADSWAVRGIDALVYPKQGLFIWDSPLYMPFFWAYMLALLGYVAIQFNKKYGLLKTTIGYGIIGIGIGPGIEFLANGARWWSYHNTDKIIGSPIYIVGGEILVFLAIPYWANMVKNNDRKQLIINSMMYGIYLWFAYAIIYYTFDVGAIR